MNTISHITDDVLLSANVPDVTVFTENPYVDITFRSSTRTLLTTRLYQSGGMASLRDLRPIIEASLENNHTPLDTFTIEAGYLDKDAEKATASFAAVYCSAKMPLSPSSFFVSNYLCTARSRRIPPDGFAWLSLFAREGESLTYTVTADTIADDGTHTIKNYTAGNNGITADADDVFSLCVTAESVRSHIDGGTITAFTVRCGGRSATFFVDEALADAQAFYFRNVFNAEEALWLPAVTTAKTTADRSIAVVGGQSQFYDRTAERTYEVQTAGLTAEECALAEQLMLSAETRVPDGDDTDFDAHPEILITDFTCEISDTAEKPNTLKFTWRYADALPHIAAAEQSAVFTEEYDPSFT